MSETTVTTEDRWPDPRRGPLTIRLGWDLIDGRYEVVAITVTKGTARRPQKVTRLDLRDVPLGALADQQRATIARSLGDRPPDSFERVVYAGSDGRTVRATLAGARRSDTDAAQRGWQTGPGRLDAEHFAKVAAVYTDAWQLGENPTTAVADHFAISKSTAAKWVSRARHEHRLLAPTTRGRPIGASPARRRKQP